MTWRNRSTLGGVVVGCWAKMPAAKERSRRKLVRVLLVFFIACMDVDTPLSTIAATKWRRKLARGKREARRPWIALVSWSRPEGVQGKPSPRPFRARWILFFQFQGRRASRLPLA